MDFYDSNYPLGYYSIGERYMFYRHMDNANFWIPNGEEEREMYRNFVAGYMEKFPEAAERIVLADGSIADPLPEEKEEKTREEEYDGLTAFQRSQLGVVTPKTGTVEGKVVAYRKMNKESGIVIGKSNATGVAMLTVLFDDGLVYEYVCGQPAALNQTDLAVKPPKGKVPPELIQNYTAKKVPSFLAEPEIQEPVETDAQNRDAQNPAEADERNPDTQNPVKADAQNRDAQNPAEADVWNPDEDPMEADEEDLDEQDLMEADEQELDERDLDEQDFMEADEQDSDERYPDDGADIQDFVDKTMPF